MCLAKYRSLALIHETMNGQIGYFLLDINMHSECIVQGAYIYYANIVFIMKQAVVTRGYKYMEYFYLKSKTSVV